MSAAAILGASFPNPVDWAVDNVSGFVGGAATAGFEAIIGGLVAWVIDAAVWVVGGVFVLSAQVLGSFDQQIKDFTTVVASLNVLSGGQATAFVVFLLGLVTVLAGIVLVAELVIREALIYIVVALAPLVFAARLWPATKGASCKLLELLCALILSKLVIAVALAVAAAAAVGSGSGGEVTSLPTPEVYASDPGGSVTQAVGILLAAAAAFGVAAFSPLLIARLLPLTESAVVAQGLRGAPLRAGHQGMSMANTAQMVGGRRINQLAAGKVGGSATAVGAGTGPGALGAGGAGGGSAAAGGAGAGAAAAGPAGLAAAAAIGAAKTVKGAASAGARAATTTAESASSSSPADRPTPTKRTPTTGSSSPKPPRPDQASAAPAPKHPKPPKGGTDAS
jgi:type IV secretion system protein TrbL